MSSTLKYPPAQIVRQLLIDMAVAADGGSDWPVFHGREPGAPDNCITVYGTQGTINGRQMVNGRIVEKRGLQVRVRSQNEKLGWTRADLIRTTLSQDVYQRVVYIVDGSLSTAYYFHAADRMGEILSIGTESPTSNRNLFTLNFVAAIREL